MIEGPDQLYKLSGWSLYEIKSGLTGARVNVGGHKYLTFKDGGQIHFNATNDYLFNIFMGTMGHQLTGTLWFKDEQNDLYGEIRLGSFKKKTQDFFDGEIKKNGAKVCSIYGNYMGFMDFDKVRYWDSRDCVDTVWFPIEYVEEEHTLPSDSVKRTDSITLKTRTVLEA